MTVIPFVSAAICRGLAALALCGTAAPALAGPAITIDSIMGSTLANPPFTIGWQFTVLTPISVTALGFFDANLNGLASSHRVGMWNSAGTLLGDGTVEGGTTSPLTNQFRYDTIAPLLLGIGTYQIGAMFANGNDALVNTGAAINFADAPEINFIGATFTAGGGLNNPTVSGGPAPGYFGPNFLFNAAAVVPEPNTLLLGMLALGVLGWSRRRQA